MNTTIIVAIITALSTTLPQIISTCINNRQQLKIKKLEYFELSKKKVITDFIVAVGNCTDNSNGLAPCQSIEYYKHLNILRTYFPDLNENNINNLTKSLYDSDESIQTALLPILKELSKLLSEIK